MDSPFFVQTKIEKDIEELYNISFYGYFQKGLFMYFIIFDANE